MVCRTENILMCEHSQLNTPLQPGFSVSAPWSQHPGAPAERSGASLEVRNTPSLAPDRPGVSLQYPAAPSPLRALSFGSFPSWDSVSANCDPCCDDSPYLAESSSRPRATCIKVCLSPSDFSCVPFLPTDALGRVCIHVARILDIITHKQPPAIAFFGGPALESTPPRRARWVSGRAVERRTRH